MRVNEPTRFWRGFVPSVRDVWRYRELLTNLTRLQLKVKYKNSSLGFLWSLARPILLLIVYSLVFSTFLRAGIPYFPIYLFTGLIVWDLFASTQGGATNAIVGNAGLIKKVYFPREILTLSVVGSTLFHFALQFLVLVGVLVVFRYDFLGWNLLLAPIAFVALVLFMTGIAFLFSVANVRYRDVQHIIEVLLLFWFWMTPIVYPADFAISGLGGVSRVLAWAYQLNPMFPIVTAFQRAAYKDMDAVAADGTPVLYQASVQRYLGLLGIVIAFSLFLIWLGQRVFAKAEGNFAQEL
ncbi:MAG: ABC transporter permease [Acidimicrobiia bacterium]|nr:ABC transporter permease [Acidimicrobiia bacterium]